VRKNPQNLRQNLAARSQRSAKIAAQDAGHVVDVLDIKRLIQAKLLSQPFDDFRWRVIITGQRADRIAGGRMKDQKSEGDRAEDGRDDKQNSSRNVF